VIQSFKKAEVGGGERSKELRHTDQVLRLVESITDFRSPNVLLHERRSRGSMLSTISVVICDVREVCERAD